VTVVLPDLTPAPATAPAPAPARRSARPSGRAPRTLRRRWIGALPLLTIGFVAAVLRVPAVGFGLPYLHHPDEPVIIGVGARMAAGGSWVPHDYTYPSMLYSLIGAVLRLRELTGGHDPVAAATSQGMGIGHSGDPQVILLLRLVTLTLSVGMCLVAGATVRRLTGRTCAGLLAGLLLAVSPLTVRNGVYIAPDTYSGLFTAAALAAALLVLRRGRRADYLLAGAAVGLAAGAKYNAVVVAVAVLAAHLLGRPTTRGRHRWLPLAAAAAAGTFLLITPGALVESDIFQVSLRSISAHYHGGHAGAEGSSFQFYLTALFTDLPLLPLAGLVAPLALAGAFRREVAVLLSFGAAYMAVISEPVVHFDRNLLPLMPALAMLAGLLAASAASAVGAVSVRGIRLAPALAALAAIGMLAPTAVVARHAAALPDRLAETPRDQARAWLAAHLPRGATVVVEGYGPWLAPGSYRLVPVGHAAQVPGGLPADTAAVVITQYGGGRFLADPTRYPAQVTAAARLRADWCSAARFTDGPWVEVLVPCRAPADPRTGKRTEAE
jgi:4-amino-4-deoxy-L-arabinose transferase-like glycosyltransferase